MVDDPAATTTGAEEGPLGEAGMQQVGGAPGGGPGDRGAGRYARGVRNPNPDTAKRIREILGTEPAISKSELARRAGVSRATAAYYLRAMPLEAQAAQAAAADNRRKAVLDHFDLLDRIGAAGDDVREVIADLRKQPTTPATAGAIFKGYGTLERLWRLIGELLGEVSPPTTNVYLTKVEALLSGPVDAARLSPDLRAALDEVQPDGSAR